MIHARQRVLYALMGIFPGHVPRIPAKYNLSHIVTMHPERLEPEQTIFLVNHIDEFDSFPVHAALRRHRDGTYHFFIRDDTYLTTKDKLVEPKSNQKKHTWALRFARYHGATSVTRPDTLTEDRQNAPFVYRTVLKGEDDLVIFPQGSYSRTGCVDGYLTPKRCANEPGLFGQRHLEFLSRQVGRPLNVQPVHVTYDPLTDNHIVTPGIRFSTDEREWAGFPDELVECTTPTILQIYAALHRQGGQTYAMDSIDATVQRLKDQGLEPYPDRGRHPVDEIQAFRARQYLFPHDLVYLANQVGHVFDPRLEAKT
ncbi:MAG: hypothetical protein ABIA93_00330 [Candidatus Woesearchaeota archaeon]